MAGPGSARHQIKSKKENYYASEKSSGTQTKEGAVAGELCGAFRGHKAVGAEMGKRGHAADD
ncbi:MAG: hypothetical protein BHW37_02600 [Firmicutes bacterium CAG:272_52_7]|nr:MAG: hypothetical protein BHW37_02600 [Firmicutes bacterium CAG:272_52_7]